MDWGDLVRSRLDRARLDIDFAILSLGGERESVCVVREFRVVRTLVIRVIAWPADGYRERTAWRTEGSVEGVGSRVHGQQRH